MIRPASRVRLHLSLHLADGTEVLSSFDGEPIAFNVGDGTLARGIEASLLGLTAGAEEQILTDGESLYGPPEPARIQRMPRADLPEGFNTTPGQVIAFAAPGGQETLGTVLETDAKTLLVDFNHPLCRHSLRLRVRVVSVD